MEVHSNRKDFIKDLQKIVAEVPHERQTLMFSATMPSEIRSLARQWLRRPTEVQSTPESSTPELVSQAVYHVERNKKQGVLTQFLMGQDGKKTLIFSRTKRGADKIARRLLRDGIHAVSIHGDKSQAKRRAVMKQFSSRRPPVLVATDLAARGLDFSGVSFVINYDLPNTPEIYVHRIGRTARAGSSGKAITLCSSDERGQLRQIERAVSEVSSLKIYEEAWQSNANCSHREQVGRSAFVLFVLKQQWWAVPSTVEQLSEAMERNLPVILIHQVGW